MPLLKDMHSKAILHNDAKIVGSQLFHHDSAHGMPHRDHIDSLVHVGRHPRYLQSLP